MSSRRAIFSAEINNLQMEFVPAFDVSVLFLQGMLQWVRCRKDVRILSLWCEHDDSTLSKTWQCDCQLQGSLEVAHLLRGIRWNDQGNGMLLVL